MNTNTDYESWRRLWKMFFPHLTENCGVALMRNLLALHGSPRGEAISARLSRGRKEKAKKTE